MGTSARTRRRLSPRSHPPRRPRHPRRSPSHRGSLTLSKCESAAAGASRAGASRAMRVARSRAFRVEDAKRAGARGALDATRASEDAPSGCTRRAEGTIMSTDVLNLLRLRLSRACCGGSARRLRSTPRSSRELSMDGLLHPLGRQNGAELGNSRRAPLSGGDRGADRRRRGGFEREEQNLVDAAAPVTSTFGKAPISSHRRTVVRNAIRKLPRQMMGENHADDGPYLLRTENLPKPYLHLLTKRQKEKALLRHCGERRNSPPDASRRARAFPDSVRPFNDRRRRRR